MDSLKAVAALHLMLAVLVAARPTPNPNKPDENRPGSRPTLVADKGSSGTGSAAGDRRPEVP